MSTTSLAVAEPFEDEFETIAHSDVRSYEAVELHDRNERGWGVVGLPHGALAQNKRGDLLMRLTRDEAQVVARLMSCEIGASGAPAAASVAA